MKKRQMKAQLLMESKGVKFEVIDIADPNSEAAKMFMQKNSTAKANARNPIPPQFFQEDEYCGDYDGFDEANENDCLEEFLKLPKGNNALLLSPQVLVNSMQCNHIIIIASWLVSSVRSIVS